MKIFRRRRGRKEEYLKKGLAMEKRKKGNGF